MLTRVSFARTRFLTWWGALPGLSSDALLYGLSAVFALGLGMTSHQGAQWQWGYLAAGPYALCALRRLRALSAAICDAPRGCASRCSRW